ncbi:MAG: ZIP family metal transporter [Candidatus Diapherotrites archaeon]
MEMVWLYALASVVLVSLISLVGVFSLSLNPKRLKEGLIFLVAFAAGALLGDALIHLLPEAVEELGFGLDVSLAVLVGVIVMFVVEKIIHWRHCHYMDEDHQHQSHVHPFAWVNLVGDSVHNFIDGMVIGAAYLVNVPVGIATTLAVIAHEVPQEIGDFGILLHGGFDVRSALWLNLLTAATSILGAVLILALGEALNDFSIWLVPFAAGSFLYIAGSDLIPELHKEVKWQKSLIQLVCFVLGIGAMLLLLGLE